MSSLTTFKKGAAVQLDRFSERLKSKSDLSASIASMLNQASAHGNVHMVQKLLAVGFVDGLTKADAGVALKIACIHGHVDVVRLLMECGVDPSDFNAAIYAASVDGQTDIVRLLLTDGRVDPSVDGNAALRAASKNGYTDIVRLLLDDERVNPPQPPPQPPSQVEQHSYISAWLDKSLQDDGDDEDEHITGDCVVVVRTKSEEATLRSELDRALEAWFEIQKSLMTSDTLSDASEATDASDASSDHQVCLTVPRLQSGHVPSSQPKDHPDDIKAAKDIARQFLMNRRVLRAELADLDAELAELTSRRESIQAQLM